MNTVNDWQKELDSLFPNGSVVTPVTEDVDNTDSNITFITGYLRVTDVNEQGDADVLCFPVDFDKDVRFQVHNLKPKGKAWYVEFVEPRGELTGYLLNPEVGDINASAVAAWRERVGL